MGMALSYVQGYGSRAALSQATPRQPYLGQVATHCFYANTTGLASATWSTGRTSHFARARIVNPIIVYPSYHINSSNVETDLSGVTGKCALELTIGGTLIQSASGTVSFTGGYATFSFPGVVIPKDAQFWVRYFVQGAGGVPATNMPFMTLDPTCGSLTGTSTATDWTVQGTTPTESYGRVYSLHPIAILSQTTRPSVMVIGTSKAWGTQDIRTTGRNDIGIARIFGGVVGYTNMGIPSSTLTTLMAASRTLRDKLFNGTIPGIATGVPYHTHWVVEQGVNDLGSITAAATATLRANLAAAYPGRVFIGTTIPPVTTSTDNFTTTANQTVTTSGSRALDFNALVRQGIAGYQHTWDIADTYDPWRTGKWIVSRNPADTAITPASFTGVIAQGAPTNYWSTLTVSALTGTIVPGAALFGTGVAAASQIMPFGSNGTSGTGGAGTYAINLVQTVGSVAMTTGSVITRDGLHEIGVGYDLIQEQAGRFLSVLE